MRRGATLGSLALLVAASGGCIDGTGGTDAMPRASFTDYVEHVQPVLARSCANPSCHGSPRRPLEIYAPQQHRSDPARLFLDEPLTTDELEHNFTHACMFLAPATVAEECELVSKPLAPGAGGIEHGGIVVYDRLDDPELQPVLDWIDEALAREELAP